METFIIKTDNAWKSLPQNISAGYVLYWYSHLLLCKFCVDKVTVPMHIGIWGRGLQLPLPKSFRLLKFFPAVIKIRTDVVCCIHVSTILSNQSVNHHHSSVITKFNFNLQRSLRRRSWWGGSRCPSHKTHPHSMISPSSFDTQPFGPQYSSFLGEKLPQPSKNIGPRTPMPMHTCRRQADVHVGWRLSQAEVCKHLPLSSAVARGHGVLSSSRPTCLQRNVSCELVLSLRLSLVSQPCPCTPTDHRDIQLRKLHLRYNVCLTSRKPQTFPIPIAHVNCNF